MFRSYGFKEGSPLMSRALRGVVWPGTESRKDEAEDKPNDHRQKANQ
jgi:hypothetical protein